MLRLWLVINMRQMAEAAERAMPARRPCWVLHVATVDFAHGRCAFERWRSRKLPGFLSMFACTTNVTAREPQVLGCCPVGHQPVGTDPQILVGACGYSQVLHFQAALLGPLPGTSMMDRQSTSHASYSCGMQRVWFVLLPHRTPSGFVSCCAFFCTGFRIL